MRRFIPPLAAALSLALALAAADAGDGRVVRVEHEGASMAVVPGGPVDLGANEAEFESLVQACIRAYPPELIEYFCEKSHRGQIGHFFIERANPEPSSRRVIIPTFAIDKREITVREYRQCVRAGGCDMTPLHAGDERYLLSDRPMVNVTWQEAGAYCRWRDARLPTEAEWEKATRGSDSRRYPWGNHERDDGANVGMVQDLALLRIRTRARRGRRPGQTDHVEFIPSERDGFLTAAPPGSLVWGQGPFGTHDMAGNVREWVADYYAPKSDDLPTVAPIRSAAKRGYPDRVVRGGSWRLPLFAARTYFRGHEKPETRDPDLGFRCARDRTGSAN